MAKPWQNAVSAFDRASGDGSMARINIEECWWSDPRRTKLIELLGAAQADGVVVNAWRLAQEFWSRNELVPEHIWKQTQANAELIQANLAEMRDGGIYVRGSSQYLSWVIERRLAASAGGRKSAEKRSKKAKQTPSKRKQTQASGSGSGSGSNSDSGILPISEKSATEFNPVKFYCDLWKAKNGKSPDIRPKEAGQLSKLAKDLGDSRSREIMTAYFSMPDPMFIKRGYDVGTMLLSLAAISQFEVHQKIVTSEAVKQIEKQVDKIQGTKRRRPIEEIQAEYDAQRDLALLEGGKDAG